MKFIAISLLIFGAVFQAVEFSKPAHFPEPLYDFSQNSVSAAKIDLGRALFYDNVLSIDSTVSCASCHSVYNAFAHTDHARSHGIQDRIGRRNAPALINLAWQPLFM
jgi:cytochrome c peroxidase